MIDTLMVLWTRRFYGRLVRVMVAFLILFICVGLLMFLVTTSGVHWLSVTSPNFSTGGGSGGPTGPSSSSAPAPTATATFSSIPVILQNPCAVSTQSTPTRTARSATPSTGPHKTPRGGQVGTALPTVSVVPRQVATSGTSRPSPIVTRQPISAPITNPTSIAKPKPVPTVRPEPTTVVRTVPTVRPEPTIVVRPTPIVHPTSPVHVQPTVRPTAVLLPTAVPVQPTPTPHEPDLLDPPSLIHGILDPLLPDLFPNNLTAQKDCQGNNLDLLDSRTMFAIMRFIFWPTLIISVLLTCLCLGLLALSKRKRRRRYL